MAKILDGKKLAEEIKEGLKNEILRMKNKPGLAVIKVGNDESSKIYIRKKEEMCRELGIYFEKHELAESAAEQELISLIKKLNIKKEISGILVQTPLPKHMDETKVMENIGMKKDVDGFHPHNIGKLFRGDELLAPCTARGVIKLIEKSGIEIDGSNAVVVGRSNNVGKPISAMLLNRNATVTVCHSKTRDLGDNTRCADILVSATGKAGLIKADMVKKGAVVVDVGISRAGGRITGDVDFEHVRDVASYITPVPGGVGPMTVIMLMENLLICHKMQNGEIR